MKELIKKTKIVWFLVFAVSFFGCEDDDEATLPQIVASFVQTIDEDTGVVTFLNLSENADSYTWDFGDGTTSTLINPTKVYPTGNYTVILTAENAAGASNTFEDQIVINIPLPINFPINFDDPNVKYEITTFNGASFDIVDNPDLSGTNDIASKVGAITNSGAAFEGLFFDLGVPLDLTSLKSVKVKFWSDTPVDILMKLEQGTGADVETTASHGGTGWEEIVFDFISDAAYSRVTLFVDGPGTTAGTFYFDDVEQVETVVPSGPQTAAPTPPARDAADVISLFSDAYSSITISEWSTGWDDADIEDTTADGDNVKKVTFGDNGGFLGVDFSANSFDATAFTHFHMDFWVTDAIAAGQILNPKWSNHAGGAEVNAFEYTNPISQSGQWVSIDIPITDFGGDTTRDNLAQFILATANTLDEVYFDNIYLYKEAGGGGGTAPTSAAPTPPARDAADVISLFSDAYSSITISEWSTGWDDADIEDTTADGDNVKKVTFGDNGGFLGVDFSANSFDATAFTHFHMDFWVTDAIAAGQILNPKWSNHAGGAEVNAFEYTNPISQSGQWVSIDIPITDFGGDTTRDNLAQFILATANTLDEVYFDNIYLYKEAGGSATEPTAAAPTPTLPEADVISIYSDAYTDVSGTDFNPGWGQSTVFSEEVVDGNNVMLYTGLNYQGIVLGSTQDVSGMEYLHIDYWTANSSALNAFIISTGPVETAKALTVPTNGNWSSIDIPLGDFTPVDLADIIQMKFDGNGDIYIDNIYFYKTNGGSASGCSGATVAATALPLDFEGCESFISTFANDGSITTELAANPSQTGNTSAYALKIVKANGTNRWAGIQNKFDSSLDITKTFKLKVYSSKANVVFKFEVNNDPQDPNSGNPAPVYVTIADANTWVDIEFAFTNIPASNTGVNQFVIKPDNPDGTDGELTDAEQIYYIDDLRLE